MKRFEPDFYAQNIFSIDVSFYKEHGIKCVLSVLDNTLDAFDKLEPSKRVIDLKNKLNKEGIELVIVSNNKEKRKGIYCTLLGVKGIFSCRKPFKKRISLFIKELNYRKEEVILVGDQLLTDVQCGKNAKIKVILTEPIVKKDQWTTKFNRLIDKPIRKHLKNKGYLERVRITNGQE